jgi:hypothetical protein
MRARSFFTTAGILLAVANPGRLEASMPEPVVHYGMCDASAVISLGHDLFVVGDDEDNALRLYSGSQPGPPLLSRDVSLFLGLRRGSEVDIEASARVGERAYWISSHGTNVRGKKRLSRQRFFATSTGLSPEGSIDLRPLGQPYRNLLQDLLREPRLARFGLAAAANRPPKTTGALSIEGLTATPEGHLLIGFRNPIPQGRALLVPLLNPADLVEGRGPARFGNPILIPLNGLGIRSIDCWQGKYLIVGGTADGKGDSWLYEWDGTARAPRRIEEVRFGGINPEAIAVIPHGEAAGDLLVVSDDGTVQVDCVDCKRLADSKQKRFRSVRFPITW